MLAAVAHLDGAEPLPIADQLTFIYNAAWREVDNKRINKTQKDFMRSISSHNAALAAANLKAAEAKLAADATAAAANSSSRRRRTRSPRQAQVALAAVPPTQPPLPPLGTCYCVIADGKCKFENRCQHKHIDSNGKEVPKPKAAAKPKPQAKNGAGIPSPRSGSRRPSKKTLGRRKFILCKFFGTDGGCMTGDSCDFAH